MSTCRNCKFWKPQERESKRYEINIGHCDIEPFQVSNMESNQMAIMCGHDGMIYTGEDFGCVNFEVKNG